MVQMSEAAVTFTIFGQHCVVILPPSLDVPPANDVLEGGIALAQGAQGAPAPEVRRARPPRPSEIVLRAPAE